MHANFCSRQETAGYRVQRNYPGRAHGFTLLELLVVVVIVAILFTYTTLAIRSDSPEDIIKKEAQRMERLTQLALEEAILRGEEYGIEIFLEGYRFLRFDSTENRWQPLSEDKILRDRELPMDMELEMRLQESEIVIDLVTEPMSDNEVDLEQPEAEDVNKEDEPKPHIFLLSSGEITPDFEIRLYILGIEASYLVTGSFDGTLETRLSEL